MNLYHGYLPHVEEKYQVICQNLDIDQMTSWGPGGRSQSLCSCTDYSLLFKGEDQVEICFIAHHEWIAKRYTANCCVSSE